jgi:hypothetical protein
MGVLAHVRLGRLTWHNRFGFASTASHQALHRAGDWLAPLMAIVEVLSHALRPVSLAPSVWQHVWRPSRARIFTDLTKLVIPVAFYVLGAFVCVLQAFSSRFSARCYCAGGRHDHRRFDDAYGEPHGEREKREGGRRTDGAAIVQSSSLSRSSLCLTPALRWRLRVKPLCRVGPSRSAQVSGWAWRPSGSDSTRARYGGRHGEYRLTQPADRLFTPFILGLALMEAPLPRWSSPSSCKERSRRQRTRGARRPLVADQPAANDEDPASR